MKKIFLLLFLGFIFFTYQQKDAKADVVWGVDNNISVYFLGYFLDHTYACVNSWSDCYSFPSGSSTSGGNANVSGQATTTQANNARARGTCCASNMYYGVDGVCHQHTNQVLSQAGLVLNGYNINGYSLSTYLFGTYGTCLYCN